MNELANPLELCGFEFIEFVSQDGELDAIFQTIGFSKVAKHKSKKVYLWRQGNINIILNYQPESYASFFYKEQIMGMLNIDTPHLYQNVLQKYSFHQMVI